MLAGGTGAAALIGWAVLHPLPSVPVALLPTPGRTMLIVVVPAAVVLGGLLVQVFRPRLRSYPAFVRAVLVWLVLTRVLPALRPDLPALRPDLPLTGTGPDVVLLAGAVAVFLVHRRGGLRSASDQELILLLITTTLVLKVPVVLDRLPAAADPFVLVLALLGPGLTSLVLDAGPLNEQRADRPHRVVATIGVVPGLRVRADGGLGRA